MPQSRDADVLMVTGAGGGIGRAIAHRMASAPDAPDVLIMADRTAKGLHRSRPEAAHPRIETMTFDVSDPASVTQAFEYIAKTYGPLSRLAHAAGVLVTGAITEATVHQWEYALAVNATGTFLVGQEASRHLLRSTRQNKAMVFVSSNAIGITRSQMGLYSASKAAGAALVRTLGLELAPRGIRCNTICPGSTDTRMQRSLWGKDAEAGRQKMIDGDPTTFRPGIPLGRIAAREDIADAAWFLLSANAKHITMHDLYVDGGASLRA